MRAYQYCKDMLHAHLSGKDLPLVFRGTKKISEFDPERNYLFLDIITWYGSHFTHVSAACHEAGHAIDFARWPRLFALRDHSRYFLVGYFINLFLEWHASKIAYHFLEATGDFSTDQLKAIKKLYRKSLINYL
jgi:Zn-dependent membrane protease YugP